MQFSENKSLYFSHLPRTISENELYKIIGNDFPTKIASINIIGQTATSSSAYVNMVSHQDAEEVLKRYNKTPIGEKIVTVTWNIDKNRRSQTDSNLYVKGIRSDVTHQMFYDVFNKFGPVISCKLAVNEETKTILGYGYVDFVDIEVAKEVFEKQQEIKEMIGTEEFVIEKYDKPVKQNTNIYVGNIPENITEEQFVKYFETFGKISEKDGKKQYKFNLIEKLHICKGCVNYESTESASKALSSSKSNVLGEGELRIELFRKREERQKEILRKKNETKHLIRTNYKEFNLLVKTNEEIDNTLITGKFIGETFKECGDIFSIHINRIREEGGKPDGSFFICMKTMEDRKNIETLCKSKGWECSLNEKYTQRPMMNFTMPMQGHYGLNMNRKVNFPMNYNLNFLLQQMSQFFFSHNLMNQPMNGQFGMNQMFNGFNPNGQKTKQQTSSLKGQRDLSKGAKRNPRSKVPASMPESKKKEEKKIEEQKVEEQKQDISEELVTEEMRNDLGDRLYDYIAERYQIDEELTGKITGVLLESLKYKDLVNKLEEDKLDALFQEIKQNL